MIVMGAKATDIKEETRLARLSLPGLFSMVRDLALVGYSCMRRRAR